jgi:hypothetical protein
MTSNAPVTTSATPLTPSSDKSAQPASCLNCGASVTGHYCAGCGQREIDPHPTVRELLNEAAEELLGWDGKLARTFRMLIANPGALTQEYLAGRRASFLSPLRLYLACSVVAFFAATVTPDPPARRRSNGALEQVGQGQIIADRTLAVDLGPAPSATSGEQDRMRHSFARAKADAAGFRQKVADAVPKLLFVLVPLLAALVALGFRRRTSHYPEHLAFTLHVHAFSFLLIGVLQLATLAHNYRAYRWTLDVVALAILFYFILAARRVYGRSIASTSGRVLVIATLYFFLFYASLGLTSIMLAFTY